MKDTFFEKKRNCTGLLGHSTLQKMTTALRIMAYGIPADLVGDNIAMAESTAIYCLRRFAKVIIKCFGELYLRAPNAEDTRRLLAINAARGFPGMLGMMRTSTIIIVSLERWCNRIGEKTASSTFFKFTMRFENRQLMNDLKKISLRSGGTGVVIKILELACLVFQFP